MKRVPHGRTLRPVPAAVAALATMTLLLTGCSSSGETEPAETAPSATEQPLELSVAGDNPAAVLGNHSLGGSAMEAQTSGKLVIADGGCLHVSTDGAAPTLLVFPQEAAPITQGRPGISLDSRDYLVGEQVDFGGGFIELDEQQTTAIARCHPSGNVFLVQSAGN